MAKIIQILEINNEILGLGDDGITYECESKGEWSACISGLDPVEKAAPKLTYCADGSGSGLIEFFYENNLIESLYYINNAEGKFKAFKKVFEAGYYAKTTLDKGE